MAKLRLGSTPSELQREEEEKQRKRYEEIHEQTRQYEIKLAEIKRKKKLSRIIVLVSFIILSLALLVFGTYNTFFKKPTPPSQIIGTVYRSHIAFPVGGLEGFIKSNIESWVKNLLSFDNQSITGVNIKLDSISIDNVETISNEYANVYFSIDIETAYSKIQSQSGSTPSRDKQKEDTTIRYAFFIPIEYRKFFEGDTFVGSNYLAVSQPTLYLYKTLRTDQIYTSALISFSSEMYDEATVQSASIKVDKILSDLYNNKDITQEFFTQKQFETYGAEYLGLDSFEMYQKENILGYNSVAYYKIKTKEGLILQQKLFMAVYQDGSSWSIYGVQ